MGKLTAASPEIAVMNTLMKGFSMLLRERRVQDFQTWTTDAMASGLPELKRFCDGLEWDRAAVVAAIELPWSNGQVEGQVHRLKLIKRQMYGRAGFRLLRSRELPYCAHPGVFREHHERAVRTAEHIDEHLPASLLRAVSIHLCFVRRIATVQRSGTDCADYPAPQSAGEPDFGPLRQFVLAHPPK